MRFFRPVYFFPACVYFLLACLPTFAEDGILVEIVYLSPASGEEEWIQGDLHFAQWPLIGEDGQELSLPASALRSREENEVLFSSLTENGEKRGYFHITHRRGSTVARFAFDRIPVVQSTAGVTAAALDRGLEASIDDLIDLRLEDEPEENFPVTLELGHRPSREFLQVDRIVAIRGLVRPGDEPTPPTGRFVQYNRRATGSGGQVRLRAATFFGGEGEERFLRAAFSPSGDAIWAIANLAGVDFAAAPQFFPDGSDASGQTFRREAGVLVQYDQDLRNLTGILRFPEDSLELRQMAASRDDQSVYLSGVTRNRFSRLAPMVRQMKSISPEGGAAVRGEDDRVFDQGGSFLARLKADGSGLDWVLFYPGITTLDFDFGPDGQILTQSRQRFWVVSEDGLVLGEPELGASIRGRYFAPIAVSPVDGSFYLGGEYHSATGLEPWRNPFLHGFDRDGKPQWTAWNWTGPLVGVRWSRLVSDSAVRQVQVSPDGTLLIRGWSDGGNSVFTHRPYDFRRGHELESQAFSIWGAGVLSVSYLMRLDPATLEVTAFNRWLSYLPSTGNPNATNIRDFTELSNRDVAFTGNTASSMIETHDAWVPAWYVENQQNPATAKPKGGPFLAVFDGNLQQLRFSTSLPGVRHQQVTSRGQHVLLSGSVRELETAYGINLPPLLRDPVQETFGGGETDAYLMLIEVGDTP